MKKRIVCFILTLIMLVSLVPVASLTASAASLSVSEAAITVLKKMTPFTATCYQVGNTQEFRIGYGTVCNEDGHKVTADGKLVEEVVAEDGTVTTVGHKTHTIGQTAADTALRAALKELDAKVNSFASSNGLSLSQNQHDALVVFSYGCGTSWMDGNGVVKTAIVNGASANELLNAMNEWTYSNDLNRRKVEVNMYMNNIYSNIVPSSYKSVTYDANDGNMAQKNNSDGTYTMLFDTTKTVNHTPVPTRNGHTFLGWYIEGSVWSPNLTASCAEKTLKALWQSSSTPGANAGVEVNYTLSKSNLASKAIYNWPDLKDEKCEKTGTVTASTVTIIRDYIGTDGTRWAKIGTDQWVIVKAGSNGISSSGTDVDVTVTVTNSYVNMRSNATIFSAANGRWNQGDQLRIINTESADGFLWGQIATSDDDDTPIGWVALIYTNWSSVKDQGNSTSGSGSSTNTKAVATATITFNGYVNVRSDAGTDNKIVGALAKNETVEVYEIKTVNGHQWGRTTAGWFCMTYASVTMLTTNSTNNIISDAGALDYAFTGKAKSDIIPFTQASDNANTTGDTVKAGTSVTITNMVVVGKATWGKIVWRVDTDNDGKADTNKTGWVKINADENTNNLRVDGTPISIDAARFQVVSDTKVRDVADNGGNAVFTITSGVEFEAVEIKLVGENIWGRTYEFEFVTGTTNTTNNTENYNGWVNLSSKYVKRINAPTIEGDKNNPITGKVATVINADSVRVRDYGSVTSGNVIGSLTRGTTVAVWDVNEDTNWYKVDSNQNGTYEYEEDGWVYGQYLEVSEGSTDSSNSGTSGTTATRTTGTGIVANTYAGVNVRTGAGTAYPATGKLLPGTQVEILETATVGAAKWGRTEKGWVCMDYIAMISYSEIPGNTTSTTGNGTAVDDLDKVDKTTTTAVYTGKIAAVDGSVSVYASPALDTEVVRELNAGDPITMYELVSVTETHEENYYDQKYNEGKVDEDSQEVEYEKTSGGGTTTTITVTSYWARVNGGYIYNPQKNVVLDALDEKVHTLTGSDTLNVRDAADTGNIVDKLEKGDQVKVTALQIVNDKVWGRIETADNGTGWIRLDYMSEGAYYVNQTNTNTSNTNTGTANTPVLGSTGNTGTGGYVTNTSGYKYTGKVINTNSVNVRATASTNATITTTLKNGASLVIYETTISENMAWGRCDAGWVYLYYVDMTPSGGSAIDARVVYNDNTIIYTDTSCSEVAGTYSRMSVIDIYEVVGTMARTDLGWVSTTDLL